MTTVKETFYTKRTRVSFVNLKWKWCHEIFHQHSLLLQPYFMVHKKKNHLGEPNGKYACPHCFCEGCADTKLAAGFVTAG